MAGPLVAAAAPHRAAAPRIVLLAGLALLAVVLSCWLMGVVGAMFGLQPARAASARRGSRRAEIPPLYLRLYRGRRSATGSTRGSSPAIGSVETDHGRSTAPGVRSGVNAFGCCAGPMQFSLVGSPSTWDTLRRRRRPRRPHVAL